jgi:hypothetical protein
VAISIKLSEICWDSIKKVNIDGRQLEVVTTGGSFAFKFPNEDKLSEALLILALQGTKKVEYLDDHRFNPARFLR